MGTGVQDEASHAPPAHSSARAGVLEGGGAAAATAPLLLDALA